MDRMETQAWLDSLQVGDRVAIDVGTYGGTDWKVITIIKITPTRMFKTDDGRSFSKEGSERIQASRWNRATYLKPFTPGIADLIEQKTLLALLDNTKFKDLSLEQLREIVRIINETTKEHTHDDI